ncbi:MAG: hypothetical protein [Bacteriophage sp.]|nr:MAG: hypothetical protein [Bacteriophage sp.]
MTKLEIDFINCLTGEPLLLVADITYRLPKIASFIERRELAILKNITESSYLYADMNNLHKIVSFLSMNDDDAFEFCQRNGINPDAYILD